METSRRSLTPVCWKTLALGFALLPALGGALGAQPFGVWTVFSGAGTTSNNGYLAIPPDPALNPTGAITLEAWVSFVSNGGSSSCRTILGKDWTKAYWVGGCKLPDGTARLRSYTRGSSSLMDGGIIPLGQWTHVAVTSDGVTRKHYINGELVATGAEGGSLTTSPAPVWIGGDVSYVFSPNGSINEVRLWNVVRTLDQIRATINVHLGTPQTGLVAVWEMGGGADSLGHFPGVFVGTEHPEAPPAILTCGSSGPVELCLQTRFAVSATFRVGAPGTAEGTAMTVGCSNPGSGLFEFFAPNNWEVMVKVIQGCALNNEWWVFSAATTNVFYRLEVSDVRSGATKVYFNYPGPPAPAVTDTNAFPCP